MLRKYTLSPPTVSQTTPPRYTRDCEKTPISADTVVAHCLTTKEAADKLKWMKSMGLWLIGGEKLLPRTPPPPPSSSPSILPGPAQLELTSVGVGLQREEAEMERGEGEVPP